MSSEERYCALQRALAANNVGVEHLERGCYSAASDALQSSMQFMKSIVGSTPMGADSSSRRCEPMTSNSSTTANHHDYCDHLKRSGSQRDPQATVQSVSFCICINPSFVNSIPESPCLAQVFPLLFEGSSENDTSIVNDLNSLSLDMVSAALLYNLAVTNLLESRRDSLSAERRSRHLKFSRSLLDVAMKIVSNDCAEEDAALPLAIVIVHGMYQVLVGLGDFRSATLAADDFYRLQDAYREGWMDAESVEDDEDWSADGPSFPSAAAA